VENVIFWEKGIRARTCKQEHVNMGTQYCLRG
jgi:hypothetical protein